MPHCAAATRSCARGTADLVAAADSELQKQPLMPAELGTFFSFIFYLLSLVCAQVIEIYYVESKTAGPTSRKARDHFVFVEVQDLIS